ncbi:ParA family protein [Halocatena halophila]|uniref:ParA family protein n=1 Tax=Halocatena halophila TaxID=2814576 RepID=UPI002ED300CF
MTSESGGEGKTMLAVNIAAALARRGYDVLAIDFDPQNGSLTSHIGRGVWLSLKTDASPNITDALTGDASIRDCIYEGPGFDFIPGHESLANLEQICATDRSIQLPQSLLRGHIEDLSSEYDYFIIDPPATLSLPLDNALFAARNILAPVELSQKGKDNIDGLERTLDEMEEGLGKAGFDINLNILSIVPNLTGDSNIYDSIKTEMKDEGKLLTPFSYRNRDVLKYAWRERVDLFTYGMMDEDDFTHDECRPMYEYEKDLFLKFDHLARLIEGEWTPLDDYTEDNVSEQWDAIVKENPGYEDETLAVM